MRRLIAILLAFTVLAGLFAGCEKEPEKPASIVTKVKVDKPELTMLVGEQVQIKASVSPSVAVQPLMSWASDNTAVATVSNGTITAVAVGSATITVTCEDKSATVKVTVKNVEPIEEPAADGGRTMVVKLEGASCDYADFAEYGAYLPGGWEKYNGIFILQHGCGMEQFGITRNTDLQYQAFATKWGLVVLETALHGDCGVWSKPERGSAQGLFKALSGISQSSGHPEIMDIPWLIWGHSGGGCWTLNMIRDYPERILAACLYSAAFNPQNNYATAVSDIPVILRHAGSADYVDSQATAENAFDKFRRTTIDAPASIVYNAGENHNYCHLRHMMIPFFESAMKQRLTTPGSAEMNGIDASKSWLGNPTTFELVKESGFSGDKTKMCRFVDEDTAKKWKEYATTNDVKDVTAPDAPVEVTAGRSGSGVVVKWLAYADVESGISCFNIYVDGKPVGSVPETGTFQAFDLNGDNAIPAIPPKMEYTITSAPDAEFKVAVETVNQFGLKSFRTSVTVEKK
ncbi:MAG: Ig-like domain-containing protein [Bacteroidales bacterium]|nr:Ig-like domain-containing protein [Bacteroidales bacterium]